ncbi:MAG: hypothetical protein SP1CHLAM54_14750 [Chlamydiia bacterium]|nr:hypothetical protein [Chlamydiia bacterium]MCH9616365.1 hypothetical protein [Chlamydiia bacterium]MCH9629649.1 hypothetical protein [Chlamydiia bacterium]
MGTDTFRETRILKKLATLLLLTTSLVAQGTIDIGDKIDNTETSDLQALRDWINTKRQVTVNERGGNLSIAGEVRSEYQNRMETVDGVRQLGKGGAHPNQPANRFDIEVNFMLDYRTDRTWAAVKIEYDNREGTSSGTFNRIALERAYLGGRAVDQDTWTIDTNIGRNRMGNMFDSKIEFGSFYDGIWVNYNQAMDVIGDAYLHGGPFVIDHRVNHFGYVFEIGVLNIGGTGLYTKYSLIDWDTHNYPTKLENLRWQFMNSQVIFGYKWTPKWLEKNITIYSGWLLNSAAERLAITNNQKANTAWYAGFSAGEARKKGDWSFDCNYQYVAPQAVPALDSSGIGYNNAEGRGLYTTNINGTGLPITNRKNARGNSNFKGIAIEFLYLITNNITLYSSWNQSVPQNREVGPYVKYRQYEFEVIYAF